MKELIDSAFVETLLKKYRFPGMGIGVIANGEVLLSEGFGLRNLETDEPITADTCYGIASCTKSFTAALAGMLADEGILELDRPVCEYLPDFRMYDPASSAQCTLRDMFTHRTGLDGYDALWTDQITRADLFARLRYLKPNHPFRSSVQYSNLMYTIAGHVLERVTGRAWDELIRERIFEPLGMSRSSTSVDAMVKEDDYARPYWQSEKGPVAVENWNVDLGGPAASINSTVSDMLKWLQFNLDGGRAGEKALLREETMAELHTAQAAYKLWSWDFEEVPPIGGYAMGWCCDVYRGHPLCFHIGEIEGYGSMQMILPREKVGIVCFNNIHKPCILLQNTVVYTILDRLLGLPPIDWDERFWAERENYGYMLEHWELDLAGSSRIEGTQLSHPLRDYTGEYAEPGHGSITIEEEAGKLKCVYRGVVQEMEHYHYDVFRVSPIKMDTLLVTSLLSFVADPKTGGIDRLEFGLYPQADPIVFKKKR